MRAVIATAIHKESAVPSAPLYLPVQAGAAATSVFGVTRDDTGENISRRNGIYSELTVHYWLWKNADAEVFGLCHYRRYFTRRPFSRSLDAILTQAELDALLQNADVIVPRPRVYLIETNYSHYAHAHRASDLDRVRAILAARMPECLPAFDRVMKRRWGRRFNMFIMRRAQFEAYSAWLFSLLFELEGQMGADIPPRQLGFVAERLMDVWLEKERPRMRQLRVLHTEGERWPQKIAAFLRRKFAKSPNS